MRPKRTRISEGDLVWWRSWIGDKQYVDELVMIISIRKSYGGKHRTIQIERRGPVSTPARWVRKKDLMQATDAEKLAARLTDMYKREGTI